MYADPEVQEEEPEVRPPTVVEINTARIAPNFTSKGLCFVKLPNFLSVDSRPFVEDHYEDEFDEEDLLDEEGRARLKLRVIFFSYCSNAVQLLFSVFENF